MSKVTIEHPIVKRKGFELSSIITLRFLRRHYPQPKPTAVTDNPEMQRMRFLTDIQSTVGRRRESEAKGNVFVSRRNITKTSIEAKENSRLSPMIRRWFERKNNRKSSVKRNTPANAKTVLLRSFLPSLATLQPHRRPSAEVNRTPIPRFDLQFDL